MIQIYDSLTRTKRPFVPLHEGEVSIYVCGVTPYAEAHVGHARPAVVWDVIKRHFMRRGYIVRHVQNFTDIDDKIVNQSQSEKVQASQLAAKYMEQYNQLMQQLHVLPPDFAPRVTENIAEIITFIQGLIDRQKAYVVGHDVYFSVNTDENYGQLSGRRIEELYQGVRVEVHEGNMIPQISRYGKVPQETNPVGRAHGDMAGRDGTLNAPPWLRDISVVNSICMAAAWT